MRTSLSFEEAQALVGACGVECFDGVWRPYKLLKFTFPQATGVVLCPKYGEFSISRVANIWKKGAGHPKGRRERQQATNLKKYGVRFPSQCDKYKIQREETSLKKYGVRIPSQSEQIKQKIKDSQNKNGGQGWGNEVTQAKARQTNLNSFGVDHPFKIFNLSRRMSLEEARTRTARCGITCDDGVWRPYTLVRGFVAASRLATFLCPKYGEFEQVPLRIWNQNQGHPNGTVRRRQETTFKLHGSYGKKYGGTAREIGDQLKVLTGKDFLEDRTVLNGKELDLYNEELKLAIEYCGLYWHNECSPEPRLRDYHNYKRVMCEKVGIRLITIFEDEYLNRKPQVFNFLKSVLTVYQYKVQARKTKFQPLEKRRAFEFLEENHIQGGAQGSLHHYGLVLDDTLLAVMTFGNHHRNQKEHCVVLDRFAVKSDYHVVGGASKLFTNALPHLPKSKIVSWSDNRWSQGGVYHKMGFNKEAELPPDYSYVDIKHQGVRISKQSQMKSLTGCPEGMTEKEWCLQRGLVRIWDCGKIRWVFDNK